MYKIVTSLLSLCNNLYPHDVGGGCVFKKFKKYLKKKKMIFVEDYYYNTFSLINTMKNEKKKKQHI